MLVQLCGRRSRTGSSTCAHCNRCGAYSGRVLDVFGDATRCGEWAVRPAAGRRRADRRRRRRRARRGPPRSDACSRRRPSPGDDLATDALAAAIGPVFRAAASPGAHSRRDERRGRQRRGAAARRAGRARRHAPALGRPGGARHRARVLLGRRRCSPRGGSATSAGSRTSRSTCARSSGAPSSSRSSAATRAARRRTPAPAATAASASPSCSPSRAAPGPRRLATGHYARIVERDGRLLLARAADPDEGPVVHARRPRSAPPRAGRVPARRPDEGGDAGPRPRVPGSPSPRAPRARRRASSAATTTAPSSSAAASRREPGLVVDGRRHPRSARTTATGASRPASARASASRPASRSTRCAPTPRTNTLVVGPRGALARDRVTRAWTAARSGRPRRGEAPLPLARGRRARSNRPHAVSGSRSTSPRTALPPGRPPCSTRTTPSSAPEPFSPRHRIGP